MNFFYILFIFWVSGILKHDISCREKGSNYLNNPFISCQENNQRRSQIPVLCYHNIKFLTKNNSPDYTIGAKKFYEHIKMLYDSGYTAILPDQLYEYLVTGKPLPFRSIMITFDDGHEDGFLTAAPVLQRSVIEVYFSLWG